MGPYLQQVSFLWQYVPVASHQWYWDLGCWPAVSFHQKYDQHLAVSKRQDEWVFTNSYITNWSVQIGQIPLQNYSSAAMNTKYVWAIRWDFEISLLYGNFYSGSSCMRFDLYRTLPGSSKIPFPSTVSSQERSLSGNIQNIVLNKVLKYESFSSARKILLPPPFCIIIYFP